MAHFYECPKADVEGSGPDGLDPVSRAALVRFWISVGVVLVAAALFYLLARSVILPGFLLALTLGVASVGVAGLWVLNRSVARIHLVSHGQAKADRRVLLALQQLDDRFAVFNGVREKDAWVDHLIVGPSGVYAVNTSLLRQERELPGRSDLARAHKACRAVQSLVKRLLPTGTLGVEPVLCVVGEGKPMVRQDSHGVWLVTLDKIVSALLRRSGQQGSISRNVSVTGAFTADLAQVRALEQALAGHWELPERPVAVNTQPPGGMEKTGINPGGETLG